MPDGMTDNENRRSRSRPGRPRPHDLRFGVNLMGGMLFTALITLGSAEGFSPGKEVNATLGGVHAGVDFAAPLAGHGCSGSQKWHGHQGGWPKGYCDSPRRVADLTLDPVGYLVGAAQTTERKPPSGLCGDPRLTGTCEEIERRLKEEGIYTSIDWQIIPSPLGGLDILGKSRVDVDLSNDTTALLYIATARDVALLRMRGHKLKFIQIYLYSPRGPQDKYYISAFLDFDRGTSTYRNYAAEYVAREQAKNAWCRQWIEPFLKKYRVDVWMGSADMANRFLANPFQWEKKIVGFRAEFQRMGTRDTGAFLFAGWLGGLMSPIMVTDISPTRFVKSNEVVLLAGRVQGVTQGAPVLVFVGVEPGPPMDQLSSGIPECTKGR